MDGPHAWHQGHRFDKDIVLIDPYAKLLEGRRIFGDVSKKLSKTFGTYDFNSLPFDWGENYKIPNIPEVNYVYCFISLFMCLILQSLSRLKYTNHTQLTV